MDRKIWFGVVLVFIGTVFFSGTHAGTSVSCSSSPGGKVTVDGVVHQMPDVVDCDFFDDGLGGYEGGNDWGYGGGGAAPQLDKTDRNISAKLECALSNYSHEDIKLGASRTMKKVNVYAFGKKNVYGVWGYEFSATNTPPAGSGWVPVAGSTTPGTAYGRLYKLAFTGGNYSLQGSRLGASPNSLSGILTDFEKSLYAAAHEASHLLGNENDEAKADWYGINAVLKYRADGGAKCAGKSD